MNKLVTLYEFITLILLQEGSHQHQKVILPEQVVDEHAYLEGEVLQIETLLIAQRMRQSQDQ